MRINEDGKVEFAENEALKALVNGASWNGGSHRWSLPTQAADGSWTPGEWTQRRPVSMLPFGHPEGEPITGWYLTRDLVEWWHRMEQHATDAYLAEWRGPSIQSSDKIGVEECRLLRPLTDAELAALGVYRSGQHDAITSGKAWVGGSAVVYRAGESVFVAKVCESGRVVCVSGSVGTVDGSGSVGTVDGSGSVKRIRDTGVVQVVRGRVESVEGFGRVDHVCGLGVVENVHDFGRVMQVSDTGRVGAVLGSGIVAAVQDSGSVGRVSRHGRVERVYGTARVEHARGSVERIYDSASVHAEEWSVVTVTGGSPKVTREGDAVIIDRRSSGPPKVYAKRGGIDGWRYRDGKQVQVKARAKGGAR